MRTSWYRAFVAGALGVAVAAVLAELSGLMSFARSYFATTASDLRLYFPVFYLLTVFLVVGLVRWLPCRTRWWLHVTIGAIGGTITGMIAMVFLGIQELGMAEYSSQLARYSWRYLPTLLIGVSFPLFAWFHGGLALVVAGQVKKLLADKQAQV